MGHNVFVVNSCISDGREGYKKSIEIWEKFIDNKNKNKFINRFNFRKMNISLIKTRCWERNLLNSDEEENIFREAKNIMEFYDIDFVIGWGNLLLEESIYREAGGLEATILRLIRLAEFKYVHISGLVFFVGWYLKSVLVTLER